MINEKGAQREASPIPLDALQAMLINNEYWIIFQFSFFQSLHIALGKGLTNLLRFLQLRTLHVKNITARNSSRQACRHSARKGWKACKFFYYIESQPLVEQRDTKCCMSEASSLSNWKNLCACLWAQDADVSFWLVFLPRRKMSNNNKWLNFYVAFQIIG